jgi:hypothetical protein
MTDVSVVHDEYWSTPTRDAVEDFVASGVSYRHGGGWWDGPRASDGYLVQQPEHWIFAGTGLARERHAAGAGIHTAAMGLFRRNGTVFSAGTTDWAQVLDAGRDRQLERITRNVLDGLLRQ